MVIFSKNHHFSSRTTRHLVQVNEPVDEKFNFKNHHPGYLHFVHNTEPRKGGRWSKVYASSLLLLPKKFLKLITVFLTPLKIFSFKIDSENGQEDGYCLSNLNSFISNTTLF